MNLIQVFQRFPDHESCIEHLERVRWNDNPNCPLCESPRVARKADGERIGRWNCHECKSSFNVLSGTIFQKTKVPLQKWFLAIALILNAKKSLSSHQLARDLDLNQKTAWYMAMRIREAMSGDTEMLSGIVEADEAYIGGKPRKPNNHGPNDPKPPAAKRGRGTKKLPIIGAVERGGKVIARPSEKTDSFALTEFIRSNVEQDALLITDNYPAYNRLDRMMRRAVIDHSVQYVDGMVHTNTIEGFWSLLKRAWYGQHHHYSRIWAVAYVIEACFKYNARNQTNPFGRFLQSAMGVA